MTGQAGEARYLTIGSDASTWYLRHNIVDAPMQSLPRHGRDSGLRLTSPCRGSGLTARLQYTRLQRARFAHERHPLGHSLETAYHD